MLLQKAKNDIIKLLGGYTAKEYHRIELKYQGLLDSKTDNTCTKVANEYMYRIFRDLVKFSRDDLYGQPLDSWVNRMYNVLRNNMYRILIRYVHMGSSAIYKLDTTIDTPDAFKKVLETDGNLDALEIFDKETLPEIQ